MQLRALRGAEISAHLDDLARLRIRVFRDFPYLYDGEPGYEREYLSTYAASARSLFVLALDGAQVVGAATGVPLADEPEPLQQAFALQGFDPARVFYFGESVLLPAYRGRGIGVRFFEAREAHAARLGGMTHCAFCAVQRDPAHPRRPADYQPLDEFWRRRGYRPQPGLATSFVWKDLDEPEASPKPMAFWLKALPA